MPDRNRPDSTAAPLRATTRVLGRALQALARAGHADEASILAAEAWAQLREDAPAEAARLTALLHGLVRIGEQAAPSPPPGANSGVALELDVRNDPPARRHERIFETFAQLRPGTAFVLVNDHDPKPLYYQFAAEHAGEVVWQPLEEGPHTWRIRIGRRDERPPGVPQSSAMIPIVELEALATLVQPRCWWESRRPSTPGHAWSARCGPGRSDARTRSGWRDCWSRCPTPSTHLRTWRAPSR
jgi:uncharacterized protein (DUF2249 family)